MITYLQLCSATSLNYVGASRYFHANSCDIQKIVLSLPTV